MILLALLGFGYLHRPLISTGESSTILLKNGKKVKTALLDERTMGWTDGCVKR